MTGHVQSASSKSLVLPFAVLTAILFPVGLQVEAAHSAKYPWQNEKGLLSTASSGRAVGGANTKSMVPKLNKTFENVLPLPVRRGVRISSLHIQVNLHEEAS
jgi:hypothetical protein